LPDISGHTDREFLQRIFLVSLSEYIRALRDNHAVGVSETSSYGALQALLNGVGSELRPSPVRCILHPSSQGAGIPDGGLFVREQLQPLGREFNPQTALEMIPARGAIEVKGTDANLQTLLASKQVAKYLAKYRKVLCTKSARDERRTVETRDWNGAPAHPGNV
jgi:hypothetical protein